MPKVKMRAKGEDKEKIRRLKQEIKDINIDFEETFAVMEEMAPPKPKKGVPKAAVIAAAVGIVLLAVLVLVLIFI